MKKVIIISAFILIFTFSVFSQTTDEKLKSTENKIQQLQKQISEKQSEYLKLISKFTSDHPDVKTAKQELDLLNVELETQTFAKRLLLDEKFAKEFPNSTVELLKIIAIQNRNLIQQNEEMIKLLKNK